MFLFASLVSAKKNPVFFITGTTGVALYADIEPSFAGSCPSGQNFLIWENFTMLDDEALSNCFIKYISRFYDAETQTAKSPSGISIHVDPIGTQGSCIGTSVLRQTFRDAGYKDFYIVPYDWSLSILDHLKPGSVFEQLKNRIAATRVPCNIIGFSMGTLITNLFLSRYVDQAWRDQHISKVVMIAPALAGSSLSVNFFFGVHFTPVTKASDSVVRAGLGHVPGLLNLFPNYVAYGDYPLAIGPNHEIYVASNVTKAFGHFGTFENDVPNIFALNEEVLQTAPVDLHIPTLIIYNTALDTPTGFDFSQGWDNLRTVYTTGDSVVPDIGPKWLCDHFSQTTCKNINCTSMTCSHSMFILNPDVINAVYEFINEEDCPLKQHWESSQ